MGKQVCVIPFRRDFLLEYTRMAPTALEIAESVDMLRVLEHGMKVRMVPPATTPGRWIRLKDLKLVREVVMKA